MREQVIPVLPCASLPDTLGFYRLLGFEVTYEQTRPYVYGATRRGDVHVHFSGGAAAVQQFGTCLIMVAEVERLHDTFADALRQAYGKLPVKGTPRITRMKPGQSRFTVFDVTGNSLVFIKQGAPEEDETAEDAIALRSGETRIARALRLAARLRDFKNEDESAAKVLDTALAHHEPGAPLERARALVARFELAVALADPARARSLRAELDALTLSAEDQAALAPELARAQALERSQQ